MKTSAVIKLQPGKCLADLLNVLPFHLIYAIESISVTSHAHGQTVYLKFRIEFTSDERRALKELHSDVVAEVDSGRPALPLA